MIGRIRSALGGALGRLFVPRRAPDGNRSRQKEVIEGSAGNVIIVKSTNTEYFKEAIFILCDDLFTRRGVDRKQLLREAKEAALSYVSDCVPPREEKLLRFLVPFLLGALSCLVVLTLIRLL